MTVEVGDVLAGRWRLLRVIAEGGMGVVFVAHQDDLDRHVAIKVIRGDANPEDLARLRAEAKVAASLDHPHIARVIDFVDPQGGSAFMVMELLVGSTLAEVLRRDGTLAPLRAVRITEQIVSALDAAHRAGVVHRDIKPSNVFLVPSETLGEVVKVLDFGIAKLATGAQWETAEDARPGTIAYMAPEQIRGDAVDRRTDVFAVGLLLYELLGGKRAFSGPLGEVSRKVRDADVAPLVGVDAELAAIVTKAIACAPERRHQSAAELGDALASWRMSQTQRAVAESAGAPGPRRERGRSVALLAIAAASLGAGVLAFRAARPANVRSASADATPHSPFDASVVEASVVSAATPASATPCASGLVACDAGCVRLDDDPKNCGACGALCTPGPCVGGRCAAPPSTSGEHRPGGPCRPATADGFVTEDVHLGLVCTHAGIWACRSGDLVCHGVCASSHSRRSCGGCDHVCAADETCSTHASKSECVECKGFVCGDECRFAGSDGDCARCNDRCPIGTHCVNRACVP